MTNLFGRRAFNTLLVGGAAAGSAVLGRPASAAQLQAPKGDVILSVTGKITHTNTPEGAAEFDRDMLEALGLDSFTTQTPWYPNPVAFEGVLAAKVMAAVGAQGTLATATALNDYSTEIPVADFARFGVLFALKRDGAYMPVRDKGPIFIVYPYDKDPMLHSRSYYGRSAWQVTRLAIG
jgi:hypothetical protein